MEEKNGPPQPDGAGDGVLVDQRMDNEAFRLAPKVFSQNAQFQLTGEDVRIIFSVKQEVVTQDGEEFTALLPEVVVYMAIPHYQKFLEVANRQMNRFVAELERRAKELGLPSREEYEKLQEERKKEENE